MKILFRTALAAVLIGQAAAVDAQSVGDDVSTIWRDARWLVGSPARASASDLQTTALLTAGFAGLLGLADDRVHGWLHTDPWPAQLLAPFREGSPMSIAGRTWFFLLPLSAALYLGGHVLDSADLREAGTGCATANLTTTLTRTSLARFVISRDRPGMHTGAFRFQVFAFGGWDQRSFPAGHASNIMSCASYFNHRFDLGLAGASFWGLATGVALGRMADDAHWASDTFAGMAYGYAVGRAVAQRGLERTVRAERSLQPGLGIRLTFAF